MRYLRQNTAIRVTVGPFLDKTDGITPEVALSATNEHLTFIVDDGNVPTLVIDTTATASGGNNDLVHITNDNAGFYDLELTAAQTNYVGRAMLSINYVTDHCPVFHEFMIVPANVYDSLFLGTDALQVHANEITAGLITATAIADNAIDLATFAADVKTGSALKANVETVTAGAITAAAIATGAIDADALAADAGTEIGTAVWATAARTLTAATNITSTGGTTVPQTGDSFARLGAPAGVSVSADIAAIEAQTDDIGAAGAGLTAVPWNAAWDAEVQSEVDDALVALKLDHLVAVADADDVVDSSIIAKLASKGATPDWSTFVNTTDSLEAIRDNMAGADAGAIADAVWDEALSGHTGAGTAGKALSDAGTGADPWDTALPGAYTSGKAGYILGTNLAAVYGATEKAAIDLLDDANGLINIHDTVDTVAGYLDTEIAAILADTNELQTDWVNGGRLDLLVDAIKAKTDNLPAAPAATGDIPSAATIADAVWDEAATGHTDAGKAGQQLWTDIDAVLVDTAELQSDWTNTGRLDTIIDAIKAKTDNLPAAPATEAKQDTIIGYIDTEIGALTTELAKVPKSDGTATWNATALASINAEVDGALNTAIPGSPTANSINERIAAIDDLTQASGSGDLAAILTDTGTTLDGKINTVDAVVDLIEDILRNKMEVTDANGNTTLYEDDGTTPKFTVAAALTDDSTTTTRKRLA